MRHIREGGEFINSGAFGCVFREALPCKSKRIAKQTVGKVFKYGQEATYEMKNNKVFHKIDPEHNFTVKTYGICDIDLTKTKSEDNIAACEYIYDTHGMRQIIYEYGGIDLYLSIEKLPGLMFDDLIPLWDPLFQALVAMKNAGVQHCDIKPDNILLKLDDRNSSPRLLLVDFGLMTKNADFFSKMLQGRFNFTYAYYPPEFKIFDRVYRDPQNTDLESLRLFIRDNLNGWSHDIGESPWSFLSKFIKTDKYIKRVYERYMSMDIQELVKRVIPQIREKLDTYSLGITIMEMFYYMFNLSRVVNRGLCERFINHVVLPMIHFDIKKRVTPEQAMNNMRVFLQQENLESKIPKLPRFPLSAPAPPVQPQIHSSLQASMSICRKPPSKGGYTIKELREIAKRMGITETHRADICAALEKHTQ